MIEQSKKKLNQVKQVDAIYMPKSDQELQRRMDDHITKKYQGVIIELGDNKRGNFLQNKTKREVKRIKEDTLWRVL